MRNWTALKHIRSTQRQKSSWTMSTPLRPRPRHQQCKLPSPPRNASCQRQPWPRREPLLVVQALPLLTKDLADLAELDTGVLLANLVALVVGEEHVGGQATLRHVGVLLSLAAGGLVGALAGSLAGGLLLRHGGCFGVL